MKRLALYLAVTFGSTWALWMLAVSGPVVTGMPVATQLLVGLGMFCPSLGVLVTWLAFRRSAPFSLPLRPRFRGNARYYLLAWFVPALATLAGAALYFLVFPAQFDAGLGYLGELAASGASVSAAQLSQSAVLQLALAVLVGPLLNVLAGAGEELGWRGLLYPVLGRKLSPAAACLVGGVIWGLWHAPVTMRGHNYGFGYSGFPWTGVLTMCVFCISLGTLLRWLTIRSGSIWPAALAHGAVNAVAGAPAVFLPSADAGNRLLGPSPAGLLAGLPLLLLAALVLWREHRKTAP